MSAAMAAQAIKTLESQFKRRFPADGIKAIAKELASQADKAIEAAVDSICLNASYLPSPANLLQRVKDEAKKIATEEAKQRETDWHKQKGGSTRAELERTGSIFSRQQSEQHAKHAVQAITLIMSDAPVKTKLDCIRAMEASYPDIGYAQAGIALQKRWSGEAG